MSRLPTFVRGQSVADWSAEELRGLVDTVRDLREWMEVTKRLHLPDLARLKQRAKAEEVSTTATIFIVVGEPDSHPREDSLDVVRAWGVSRTRVYGQWRYSIGVGIGNQTVWPGRNLGWYRSHAYMYPWDTAIGTSVDTSHLRQYRIMRIWDMDEEHYAHEAYIA